jgi:hypothetical protein
MKIFILGILFCLGCSHRNYTTMIDHPGQMRVVIQGKDKLTADGTAAVLLYHDGLLQYSVIYSWEGGWQVLHP